MTKIKLLKLNRNAIFENIKDQNKTFKNIKDQNKTFKTYCTKMKI